MKKQYILLNALLFCFSLATTAQCVNFDTISDGQTVEFGEEIYVQVTLNEEYQADTYGIILFLDNKYVRTERFAPYEWNIISPSTGLSLDDELDNLSCGSHELKAVLWSNEDFTYSCETSITINVACTGGETTPAVGACFGESNVGNGFVYIQGHNLSVEMSLADDLSEEDVQEIQLFYQNEFVRSESTAPYVWGGINRTLPNYWDFTGATEDELMNLSCGEKYLEFRAIANDGSLLCSQRVNIHILCVECGEIGAITSSTIDNSIESESSTIDVFLGQRVEFAPQPIFAAYSWSGPNGFSATNRKTKLEITDLNQSGVYTAQAQIGNCTKIIQYTLNVSCPPAGTSCDDGNALTFDDIYDQNCQCAGTLPNFRIQASAAVRGYHITVPCLECRMANTLNEQDVLPKEQPFNQAPFNYNGTESVEEFSESAVDWVLIVARNADGNAVDRLAAIMHEDASITSADGTNDLTFNNLDITETYLFSIHHKGHLGVLSAQEIPTNSYIDFTNPSNIAGSEQFEAIDGYAYMNSGDFNNDGIINSLDFNIWKSDAAGVGVYAPHDADGNGLINNLDYNFWERNRSKIGEGTLIDADY